MQNARLERDPTFAPQKSSSDPARLAIMQPYFFPYIGYFQLIHSSDLFIFYDDVAYIKGGWINRNLFLQQNQSKIFTVPVSKASSHKLINQTLPALSVYWINRFYRQLCSQYQRAPYFKQVIEPIMTVFVNRGETISDLAIGSVKVVFDYLDLAPRYAISSSCVPKSRSLKNSARIIGITKELKYSHYINLPGGRELYSPDAFLAEGVKLSFICSQKIVYQQFATSFLSDLSIIDVLMFNDKETVLAFLAAYTLN